MPVHIDRVGEIARALVRHLRRHLKGDGLVFSTHEFNEGFNHGVDGFSEGAPWYRKNDNYMLGIRAGYEFRMSMTTPERN